MAMNITIHLTGGESGTELNALAALIASLGGRAPTAVADARAVEFAQAKPGEEKWPDGSLITAPTTLHVETLTPAQADQLADDHSEQDAGIVDAAVAAGAPSVDSKGIPWDARIHSESRATVADGTWRKRRNVDEAIYASVLAELSGNAPADDAPEPPAGNTAGDASDDVPNAPDAPVATVTPVVAAASASDSTPMTFPQFVQAVQGAPVPDANKSYVKLNELAATLGVGAFKDMKDHADKFDMFLGMLG